MPISKYDVSKNNKYKDDYRYDVSKYDNRTKQIIYRKGSDTYLTARTNLNRYLIWSLYSLKYDFIIKFNFI